MFLIWIKCAISSCRVHTYGLRWPIPKLSNILHTWMQWHERYAHAMPQSLRICGFRIARNNFQLNKSDFVAANGYKLHISMRKIIWKILWNGENAADFNNKIWFDIFIKFPFNWRPTNFPLLVKHFPRMV